MAREIIESGRAEAYREDRERRKSAESNIGPTERVLTAIGGGVLLGYGISRRSVQGTVSAVGGGALLARAFRGYCPLYSALGINTASRHKPRMASVSHGRGLKIERSVMIDRPREELYRFWHNVENLPKFMSHLKAVTRLGGNRSHWLVTGPAGTTVEWDAEFYNENEPEFLAWRSLEGADINHAGSVHFTTAPGGGTEVRVALNYEPPARKLGSAIAKLFGEEPEQQVEDDLHALKRIMEFGHECAETTPPTPSDTPPVGEHHPPEF